MSTITTLMTRAQRGDRVWMVRHHAFTNFRHAAVCGMAWAVAFNMDAFALPPDAPGLVAYVALLNATKSGRGALNVQEFKAAEREAWKGLAAETEHAFGTYYPEWYALEEDGEALRDALGEVKARIT